ncbi:MAG: tRNA 2-thiouridine(34) synthase MnmA [Clostridia bacterium]|nr:tRNA 2-thiouridine(34) synthase MnmA [Clostridia bacterium]
MNKKKVMVGMSGGVDSSAAALILLEQGYDVYGATMRLIPQSDDELDKTAEIDAKKVCDQLGIKHYVFDMREEFKKYVVDYFVEEYINARTPNPCIACNKHLKFGLMLERALEMGMDYIATGHYARIEHKDGEYKLKMSDAQNKDQSYVLYNLNQFILSHTLMPLGDYTKEEIRQKCIDNEICVANKSESMEICFVKDDDYVRFIKEYSGYNSIPGKIYDTKGNEIGIHNGLINYTIGQRKGIGAYGRPMFVLKIDGENNSLILGEKGMEFSSVIYADGVNYLSGQIPKEEFSLEVKIRYQAKPAEATIVPQEDNSVKILLKTPQRAITPGQSVVFYDGDYVVGGGIVRDFE